MLKIAILTDVYEGIERDFHFDDHDAAHNIDWNQVMYEVIEADRDSQPQKNN